jgi:hypothetical protein
LLIGCVVQNGLEHPGEPEIFGHDANVLVLTQETGMNLERASPVSPLGSSATTQRQPRPGRGRRAASSRCRRPFARQDGSHRDLAASRPFRRYCVREHTC